MKGLNESNPVDIAEYVVSKKIYHEPAFKWWVPYTLRKRNRIIPKLQKKYWRKNCKFGIEVPSSIKRAYEIYEETHTDLWRKVIAKEMLKVKIAYVENEATPEQAHSGEAQGFIGFQ